MRQFEIEIGKNKVVFHIVVFSNCKFAKKVGILPYQCSIKCQTIKL